MRSFLISSYLDGVYKEKVHITQLLFVALMIILWGTSIAAEPKGMPTSRAPTAATAFAKSCQGIQTLIAITYQLPSAHFENTKFWRSQAYATPNPIEILVWFVMVIVTFTGFYQGASCGLSWVVSYNCSVRPSSKWSPFCLSASRVLFCGTLHGMMDTDMTQ